MISPVSYHLMSLCRSIRSVCGACGQASNKSWCFYGTETQNAAASRTQSKRWGTWSTRPATSRWDTPCTPSVTASATEMKWMRFTMNYFITFFFFSFKRYVSPLTTSYAGTHRTLRSIGGGALSLDSIRSWLCTKWLRSVDYFLSQSIVLSVFSLLPPPHQPAFFFFFFFDWALQLTFFTW